MTYSIVYEILEETRDLINEMENRQELYCVADPNAELDTKSITSIRWLAVREEINRILAR